MAEVRITKIDTEDLKKKTLELIKVIRITDLLGAIGARHLRWINDQFKTAGMQTGSPGRWKALRPGTIAGRRKGKGGGSAQILQDTGRLRMSFATDVSVGSGTVTVGTTDVRAPWHDAGTRPYRIRPKNKKALAYPTATGGVKIAGRPGQWRVVKEVRHPGLPKRPLLPRDEYSMDMASRVILAAYEKVLGKQT